MGNVVIASNIKRQSARIDPAGNLIDAKTKQIIQPVEPVYIPPATQAELLESKEIPLENKVGSKIDEMINRKIEELVAKKIEEALSKL